MRHSQTPLNRLTSSVKAKDVTPGQHIGIGSSLGLHHYQAKVLTVTRAADEVERVRKLIGAPKRPSVDALADLVRDLSAAIDALQSCGREARLIRVEGRPRWLSYSSQEDVLVVR